MSGPRLVLERLAYRYPGAAEARPDGVSLEVGAGEWVCVAGPNGSGKSTLLRLAAGLLRPLAGGARIEGLPGAPALRPGERGFRRAISYLSQLPHEQILGRTVGDERASGLEWHGVPAEEIAVRIAAASARLGSWAAPDQETRTLSGGRRHRLALGAALLPGPAFLIVDEPLAGLDPFERAAWLAEIGRLRSAGLGVLSASTSAAEASRATRVWILRAPPSSAHPVEAASLLDKTTALAAGLRPAPGANEVPPLPAGPRSTAPPAAPRLRFHDVEVRREETVLWQAISLDVPGRGLTAVFGRNGVGKTSLAMALAGLLEIRGGRVEGSVGWSGPAGRRRAASSMAFQNPEDQLTGAAAREELGPHGRSDDSGAVALLSRLGLGPDILDRPVFTLSAGERRKVALAALAAQQPDFLIMDEPLLGLDGPGAAEVHPIGRP